GVGHPKIAPVVGRDSRVVMIIRYSVVKKIKVGGAWGTGKVPADVVVLVLGEIRLSPNPGGRLTRDDGPIVPQNSVVVIIRNIQVALSVHGHVPRGPALGGRLKIVPEPAQAGSVRRGRSRIVLPVG